MQNTTVYDITKGFLEQFKKENVISFFEFQFASEEIINLHGLCKISKPKDPSAFNYVSIVFIADTPAPDDRSYVNSALHSLIKVDPESIAEGVESIVAIPDTSVYKEHVVQQFDMIFKPHISTNTEFILEKLCPSICNICKLKSLETIPWDIAIQDIDKISTERNTQNITSAFKDIINELKI